MGAVSSLLGTLLQVRPVLSLDDGALHLADRPRTTARAIDRMVELVADRAARSRLRVAVHTYGDEVGAQTLVERLQPHSATPVPAVPLPAVLAAHVGLGALAVVAVPLDPDTAPEG